jgi:hypothetical protein
VKIAQDSLEKLKEVFIQNDEIQLTSKLVFLLLIKQYKWQILFIVFLNAIEMACRLGFSIMLV